jgi:hypothetical protein
MKKADFERLVAQLNAKADAMARITAELQKARQ